jgi:transposase
MSTNPPSNLQVERLDDLPLLMEHLKQMEIQRLMDENIRTHGNWQGLSLGWTVTVWLAHILTQGDHCLVHVQEWVATHLETLRELTGIETLSELDFTDDRLQVVLRYLNKDEEWAKYQQEQGKHFIRVYDLAKEVVRLDSTTASTYQAVNPEGILRLGVSKDHRPDLAQLKVMLGTLDPLGIPLVTQVVSGNSADDPLYIPAIKEIRTILNQKGVLFYYSVKIEDSRSIVLSSPN